MNKTDASYSVYTSLVTTWFQIL